MKRVSKYRVRRFLGMLLTYIGVAVALVFFLFPFLWILTTSLKGNEDYFSFPPVWLPTQPSLAHYFGLFSRGNGWLYFKNSLSISSLSMLAALCFSVPTAYSIARFRFGGKMFSNFLLLLRTMPAIALVIPIYVLYRQLGLINHYFGLILLYTVFYIPFAVWLMIGFDWRGDQNHDGAGLVLHQWLTDGYVLWGSVSVCGAWHHPCLSGCLCAATLSREGFGARGSERVRWRRAW